MCTRNCGCMWEATAGEAMHGCGTLHILYFDSPHVNMGCTLYCVVSKTAFSGNFPKIQKADNRWERFGSSRLPIWTYFPHHCVGGRFQRLGLLQNLPVKPTSVDVGLPYTQLHSPWERTGHVVW